MDQDTGMDAAAEAATGTELETTATTESTPGKEEPAPTSGLDSMVWLIVIWIVVLYFFFMRPNRRKEKQRKEQIAAIQKGDKVITIGGIHGEVMKISDEVITIRTDEKTGATLKCSRAAVNVVVNKDLE